ncbi:MAG: hypothetical protein JXB30_14120 [Anaerolineae bacterium]|nr:hypothetical protein [Anaerolineae bacterium]
MRTKKSLEQFLCITPTMSGRQRGQILLIVAMAMIGLLVAAGLAVDAGFLMLRKSQFDRAVDSAALSGAPLVTSSDLNPANTQGRQFLAANGIVIPNATTCDSNGNIPSGYDYCGAYSAGVAPGSSRYRVVARWNVPLFFMPLIDINNVPLVTSATAEYINAVDLYASNSNGLVYLANQAPRGPDACRANGDAFSPPTDDGGPANEWYGEINGAYTYRIIIPSTYAYDKVRVEFFDPDHGNIRYPSGTGYDRDGDSFSYSCGTSFSNMATNCMPTIPDYYTEKWFVRVDETGVCCSSNCNWSNSYTQDGIRIATLFRLYYFKTNPDGSVEPVDLAYYIGKYDTTGGQASDQQTSYAFGNGTYNTAYSAAQGNTEALATDLKWVSPGQSTGSPELMPAYGTGTLPNVPGHSSPAEPSTIIEPCTAIRPFLSRSFDAGGVNASQGYFSTATECGPAVNDEYTGQNAYDFIINLNGPKSEVPDIYETPGGQREIYLQVATLVGASENDFEIWAGPPRSLEPNVEAPAEVNARQIWILNHLAATPVDPRVHSSQGLSVNAIGRMTMNMLTAVSGPAEGEVKIPLFYVGPEDAGQEITVDIFDADTGTWPPLIFVFDTIPDEDWNACWERPGPYKCPSGYNVLGTAMIGSDGVTQDQWRSFTFTVPSETPGDCGNWTPFYGGRLVLDYTAGNTDNITYRVTLKSRPRLVQ